MIEQAHLSRTSRNRLFVPLRVRSQSASSCPYHGRIMLPPAQRPCQREPRRQARIFLRSRPYSCSYSRIMLGRSEDGALHPQPGPDWIACGAVLYPAEAPPVRAQLHLAGSGDKLLRWEVLHHGCRCVRLESHCRPPTWCRSSKMRGFPGKPTWRIYPAIVALRRPLTDTP